MFYIQVLLRDSTLNWEHMNSYSAGERLMKTTESSIQQITDKPPVNLTADRPELEPTEYTDLDYLDPKHIEVGHYEYQCQVA